MPIIHTFLVDKGGTLFMATATVQEFDSKVTSGDFLAETKRELKSLFKACTPKVIYTSTIQPDCESMEDDDGVVITAPFYGALQIGNKRCVVTDEREQQALSRACIQLSDWVLNSIKPWLGTVITYNNTQSIVAPKCVDRYPFMKTKHTFTIKADKSMRDDIIRSLQIDSSLNGVTNFFG